MTFKGTYQTMLEEGRNPCPFCGGGGRLVTVEDGRRPYIRSGDRLVLRGVISGTERNCHMCDGSGILAPAKQTNPTP